LKVWKAPYSSSESLVTLRLTFALSMCLFCFSTEKPSADDMKGKYGAQYAPYLDYQDTYDITMCQAPCAEPGCWFVSMLCFCCAQISMRKRALNHVNPGSGWDDYACCQGYYGGCCCFQPGQMGEKACPLPCMFLETCCCPGLAVSATSSVIRERYQLGLDDDDIRLIRFNNCLQLLACVASCLNICIDCEGDDACVAILDCIADVVFCMTSGCMTAQVYHEINLREKQSPPVVQEMAR